MPERDSDMQKRLSRGKATEKEKGQGADKVKENGKEGLADAKRTPAAGPETGPSLNVTDPDFH